MSYPQTYAHYPQIFCPQSVDFNIKISTKNNSENSGNILQLNLFS